MSMRTRTAWWLGIIGMLILVAGLVTAGFTVVSAQGTATVQATQIAKATAARSTAQAAATTAATKHATAAAAATKAATAAANTPGHPAHVHMGTCSNLNPNPQYPLPNVLPISSSAGVSTVAPTAGTTLAPVTATIESSSKKIDAKLDDLLKSPHAVNVHESATDITTYIACGDIAGPIVDDTLVIGLHEQNNSGYSGIAILKRDGDSTDVTIYLAKGLTGAMPVASPTA